MSASSRLTRRKFLKALALGSGALVSGMPAKALAEEASENTLREFNVEIRRYRYTPSVFRVNKGDTVRFKLVSTDVEHGFYIDGYDLNVRVKPYEEKTLEFVADRSGAFQIRCSVTCGPTHPIMRSKLVVEPNNRFWASLAMAFFAPLAMLGYLYHNGGDEHEE
jgi:cytochrome c oxidase subunit 2